MAELSRRRLRAAFYFLLYVVRRYWRDEALDLASSLAYTSLLSMVPLLAIGLGILAAFPGFDSLRHALLDAIFRDWVPEVGNQVQYYMGRFAANAGRLTAFGIAGLVATAVMLLVAIEAALNRIFRVAHVRATGTRIIVYWAALTVGPVLAGIGLTMSAWFSLLPWVKTMHLWAGRNTTTDLRNFVDAVSPFIVLTLAFTLLFLVTPNRRVRIGDALTGGVVAALLVMGLRGGFALYIAYWGAYRPVYGAVATMPIFLAWVYLSWTAVLFGAEIAAALPERRHRRLDVADKPLDGRGRLALALSLLAVLSEGRDNQRGYPIHTLTETLAEGERPIAEILRSLIIAGMVERRGRNRYIASEGLAAATLSDLLGTLKLGLGPLTGAEITIRSSGPDLVRVGALIAAAARAEADALLTPLHELIAPRQGETPASEA
ncbi:MAG TPA: YihY family inner membrane protein [Magnetospirillaceae bacterium]|jgi:membrane protein